jgi:hypothetical protein
MRHATDGAAFRARMYATAALMLVGIAAAAASMFDLLVR